METSNEDLEWFLMELPPGMQRAARRMLYEWGVAPAGDDSFPVRLSLLTRLQLYALVKTGVLLTKARRALEDWAYSLRTSLQNEAKGREVMLTHLRKEVDRLDAVFAHEADQRQQFLKVLHSEHWGEAELIRSAARRIEQFQQQHLEQVENLLRDCPKPERLADLLDDAQKQSSRTQQAISELRLSSDGVCRAVKQIGETLGEFQKAQAALEASRAAWEASHTAVPPAIVQPAVVPQKDGSALGWIILAGTFFNTWLNNWQQPLSGSLMLICAACALCQTFVLMKIVGWLST